MTKNAELKAKFLKALMKAENGNNVGYDDNNNTWAPHQSLEGGTPTIAYGHKLEQRDIDNGDIFINGKPQPLYKLPHEEALELFAQDVKEAEDTARKQWNVRFATRFDDLEEKYQYILIDKVFNVGNIHKWPKLCRHCRDGNDDGVYKEMLVSYVEGGSGKKKWLTLRRNQIADAVGLNY